MHAGQVLADDAQSEKLSAGEDRDDGGKKRESRNRAAVDKESGQDID